MNIFSSYVTQLAVLEGLTLLEGLEQLTLLVWIIFISNIVFRGMSVCYLRIIRSCMGELMCVSAYSE